MGSGWYHRGQVHDYGRAGRVLSSVKKKNFVGPWVTDFDLADMPRVKCDYEERVPYQRIRRCQTIRFWRCIDIQTLQVTSWATTSSRHSSRKTGEDIVEATVFTPAEKHNRGALGFFD